MTISPAVALVLKVVLSLANGVVNGTLGLAGVVDAHTAVTIALCCQAIVTMIGVLTDAYSSNDPGPFAPPNPTVVAAAKTLAALPPTAPATAVQIAKAIAKRAVDDHDPSARRRPND
jgi:hypothetical protein